MAHTLPIYAHELIQFHDQALINAGAQHPHSGLWQWVADNHRNNTLLWAQEDLARRQYAQAADIMANKRAIDAHNQARNDAIEKIDEYLLIALGLMSPEQALHPAPQVTVAAGARLNSETAGSMVDRMSITALKINAMRAHTQRTDTDPAFIAQCQLKLTRLLEQRHDLGQCLEQLLADSLAGLAYFKVYRQFKMYNDPAMNPILLAERQHNT